MSTNEDAFRARITRQFGSDALKGKRRYSTGVSKADVRISVDESLEIDDRLVLVEIDSGNAAKLLIGQYILLSVFEKRARDKVLFVVVHYYDKYNADRTAKNFQFIATSVLAEQALPFVALHESDLWTLLDGARSLEELWAKLTLRVTGTHQ
ncbi:MAG: hypothetical protein KGO52_10215 [Nitrospirota bacterium]|nr:hypothetical protein [Nitrospirota bacterium]